MPREFERGFGCAETRAGKLFGLLNVPLNNDSLYTLASLLSVAVRETGSNLEYVAVERALG
jgi:hypothetical protein